MMKRDDDELMRIMFFLLINAQNWLEVFFGIRRMSPSLVSVPLDHSLSSQRQRIAAAMSDVLDGDQGK